MQFYNGTTLLGQDATSPYSFTWNNVQNGSYNLIAKAVDNNTCKDTVVSKVTVNHVVTGLEEDILVNGIAYFPNPFSNSFTIRASSTFHYTMYDLAGIEVEKGTGTAAAGQQLAPGMYMVKIQTETRTEVVKVKKF